MLSLYLRTTAQVIAFLLFASHGYTLPGKHCKGVGSKSKDRPHGLVHIYTIQAVDCGGSFYCMRGGCTERKKSQPIRQIARTDSHLCNRNCLQFIQDIDSHRTTKERAFITYHAVDLHIAEQRTN